MRPELFVFFLTCSIFSPLAVLFLALTIRSDRRDLRKELEAAHARRVEELLNKNNLSLKSLRADRDEYRTAWQAATEDAIQWKRRAEIIDNAGELLKERRIKELERALTQETEARKRSDRELEARGGVVRKDLGEPRPVPVVKPGEGYKPLENEE